MSLNTPTSVLSKRELLRQVRRFLKDKDRGISRSLFADLCGIHKSTLDDVFLYQAIPLTEYIQRRVDKGFKAWKNGEVAIMQNRDTSRFVQYRRDAKPRMGRTMGLQLINNEIKIKLGVSNKADYSQERLDEQLDRG